MAARVVPNTDSWINHGRNASKYNYRSSQNNNNYVFSPRFDCQQNAHVVGAYNKDKLTSLIAKDDTEKRTNKAKKVKNQILSAYMDKSMRIKPISKNTTYINNQ